MTGIEKWTASIDFDAATGNRFLRVRARQADGSPIFFGAMVATAVVRGQSSSPLLTETFEEARDNLGEVTGFVQAILDAAYEAGMRPTLAKDRTDEMRATRAHLEDMRALVFERPKP